MPDCDDCLFACGFYQLLLSGVALAVASKTNDLTILLSFLPIIALFPWYGRLLIEVFLHTKS